MGQEFEYDVFLSHSSKDKAVVRPLAERLRKDGLKVWFDEWVLQPGDSIPAKIEEGLERSRVLVLCMSANAFGSDWAQLEAGTFRFRDPLNQERRFIPLRLDEAPIKASLAQLLSINWRLAAREQEYAKLLEACRRPVKLPVADTEAGRKQVAERAIQLDYTGVKICSFAFSADGKRVLSGGADDSVRLWDMKVGRCLGVLEGHTDYVRSVVWSADQSRALSCSDDNTLRLWDVSTGRCLGVLKGHTFCVLSLFWSADERHALSGSADKTVRLWEVQTGHCLRALEGHDAEVWSVAWSADERRVLSGGGDSTVRLWDVRTGSCLLTLEGHTDDVESVAWSHDQRRALSGCHDKTVRLWDLQSGRCLRVLEGHTDWVRQVTSSPDGRYALSGGKDKTVRLWNVDTGRCLRVLQGHTTEIRTVVWSTDGRRALSGDEGGGVRMWDLSEFVTEARAPKVTVPALPLAPNQVQYTNAKVLLVGETHSGKTGLVHRLATGAWKPTDGSTVGAWSTQWRLKSEGAKPGVEREIWLWDFGGQSDQRLIHQLYMDRTALILLLFDADQEEVLPGLRDWRTALRRSVPAETAQLLVAGRVDAGFKASRGKLQAFAKEEKLDYVKTSAKTGEGCDKLRAAILAGIPWANIPVTTTEHLFKVIKDEILKLRDEGQVLYTFKELREELWRRLPDEPRFTDEKLKAVVSLLDGPGAVKELDYGTYILLQPEWVSAYAQAVIRTLRSDEKELGCLPLQSIAEGRLLYQ
jgi:small GTP-binding protein